MYVIIDEPITMIDTGVATDRAFDALVTGLRENCLALTDVKRIILTHKHIDHIGNAWRIQQYSDAEIMIHDCEVQSVTDVDPAGEQHAAVVARRLDEWKVPSGARPSPNASSLPRWEIQSAIATGLTDGQRIPLGTGDDTADGYIEVVHTPGHTAGSICLRYGSYLFTGDHVLPDVSPNVGGGDMRRRNLLRDYLSSLHRVRTEFSDDRIQVMPGHGGPMETLTDRCNELIRHHEQRLDETVHILREHGAQSVYEVAARLFGEMKSFHVVLGCAEACAHLELLVERGCVVNRGGKFSVAATEIRQ